MNLQLQNKCILCLEKNNTVYWSWCNHYFVCAQRKTIEQKVDSVMDLITIDEKIGQLTNRNYHFSIIN